MEPADCTVITPIPERNKPRKQSRIFYGRSGGQSLFSEDCTYPLPRGKFAYAQVNHYICREVIFMNSIFLPGIGTAFLILFGLLYFVVVMVLSIIFIERVWTGPSKWLILPVVVFTAIIFVFHPSLLLRFFETMSGLPILGFLGITGLGMLAGMAASSL